MLDKYTAQAPTTEEAIEKGMKALNLTREEAVIEVVEEGKKGFLGFGQKDAVVTVRRKETKSLLDEVLPQSPVMEEKKTEAEPEDTALTEVEPEPETSVSESVAETPESPAIEETEESRSSDEEEDEWEEEDESEEDFIPEGVDDDTAVEEVMNYLLAIGEAMGAGPIEVEVERQGSRVRFNLLTKKAGIIIGHHGKVLNALQALAQVQLHKQASRKLTAIVDAEGYRKRRQDTLESLANRTARKVSRTKQPVVLEPMPAFERKLIHRFLSDNQEVTTHSEGKEPHRYLVVEPIREKKSILDQ